jgi:hypothetical protein
MGWPLLSQTGPLTITGSGRTDALHRPARPARFFGRTSRSPPVTWALRHPLPQPQTTSFMATRVQTKATVSATDLAIAAGLGRLTKTGLAPMPLVVANPD